MTGKEFEDVVEAFLQAARDRGYIHAFVRNPQYSGEDLIGRDFTITLLSGRVITVDATLDLQEKKWKVWKKMDGILVPQMLRGAEPIEAEELLEKAVQYWRMIRGGGLQF